MKESFFSLPTVREPQDLKHYIKSKDLIRKGIGKAEDTALLIGAGKCRDIPLPEILENFDSIEIVDLNFEGAKEALKQVPVDLRKKIHLNPIDASGGMAELYFNSIVNCLEEMETFNEDAFAKCIGDVGDEIKKGDFSLPYNQDSFDLIVSSCIISQFHTMPVKKIMQLILKKFGSEIKITKDITPFEGKTASIMQRKHIEEISRLLKKDSIGVLTTTAICEIAGQKEQLVDVTKLTEVIKKEFKIKEDKEWIWSDEEKSRFRPIYTIKGWLFQK